MNKKLQKNFYYICLIGLLLFFVTMSVIGAYKIYNLKNQLKIQTTYLNNVLGQNVILKARVDYEQQQKQIYYRIIEQKVEMLNSALSRIYPGYNYRYKINQAINNNAEINSLPESLLEIYLEQKYIMPHGLENYQLSIPDIIWPVDPAKSYITMKSSEYGMYRNYPEMNYQHEGIDIGCINSNVILAVYDGEIYRIWYSKKGGWTVELKFKTTAGKYYFVRYRHCDQIFVKQNDIVKQKDIIASIGNTGNYTTGKHLHFETWIWINGHYKNINPVLNSTWGNPVINSIF